MVSIPGGGGGGVLSILYDKILGDVPQTRPFIKITAMISCPRSVSISFSQITKKSVH